MYETVLVASRGPLARRVARTCQRLGARAVSVHSEADAGGAHVAEADDSVLLGPAPPEQSYLDRRRVVEAARQSGAQAVHPGGGPLATDAELARAVLDAGLDWIGAPPEVLDRAAALRAPAPTGQRVVTVHVLAPTDGPAVALAQVGRRDAEDGACSIVAATPVPGLSGDLRRELVSTAQRAAEEVGARGVAAVELALRPDGGCAVARVQCGLPLEHALSELRWDVDLVEQQLLLAAGHPSRWRPSAGGPEHGLQLRVYAQDVPCDGTRVTRWQEPVGVRIDSACREGDVVSPWYDPLLATVTVVGPTAHNALSRARAAVDELRVEGPSTNLPQLAALLADPSFIAA